MTPNLLRVVVRFAAFVRARVHTGLSYIIRAHEATASGIRISKGAKVFTVFSTSKNHNCGEDATCGCILVEANRIHAINRAIESESPRGEGGGAGGGGGGGGGEHEHERELRDEEPSKQMRSSSSKSSSRSSSSSSSSSSYVAAAASASSVDEGEDQEFDPFREV
jgi:hypothetical protein